MEITSLRNEIDSLDKEITALLIKRMGVSAQVAQYKIEKCLPVLDKSREEALLNKIASLSGDMAEYTLQVYREILSQSKEYQKKLMSEVAK